MVNRIANVIDTLINMMEFSKPDNNKNSTCNSNTVKGRQKNRVGLVSRKKQLFYA